MIHYLYKITNKENGKVYIGVTSTPQSRKRDHLNGRGRGSKEIAKDLPGDFTWEILEEGEKSHIYNREFEEIETQNTYKPNGYNIKPGGTSGWSVRGEDVNTSKLVEQDILDIRVRAANEKYSIIAKDYNINPSSIGRIATGKTWKHIGGTIQSVVLVRGEECGASVLLEQDIINIRELAEDNMSFKELGDLFSVTPENIGHIVRGKTWKHVKGPIRKPRRKTVVTQAIINKIIILRNENKTYTQIGLEVDLHAETASRYYRKYYGQGTKKET